MFDKGNGGARANNHLDSGFHLLGLGGDDACRTRSVLRALRLNGPPLGTRTLNVGDALLENLLQDPWVLELPLHLCNDGRGQLLLLALLDLALVAGPRLEDSLGLGGEARLLLELESLGLELGGFLVAAEGESKAPLVHAHRTAGTGSAYL